MKLDKRARAQLGTAQALRELIKAEMAHERAAADEADGTELQTQVEQARERYRRLSGAGT